MYLRRLDLIAFGHFTRYSVDLTPGLNIVYGDNEAGKSTTLRALRQLLFGFDHKCPDMYLHNGPDLRIGAVLVRDDEVLEVIRRKKRKDSLRAADDQTVVSEQRLEAMLDGIDADGFRQRFGIDYQQLVTGGQEICEGRGDLGQILFAAASGVADLRHVQQQLAEEAQQLYKPSGSVPALNKLLAEHRELRGRIKQLQLSSSEWEQHDQRLREAKNQSETVLESLRRKQAEKTDLERLRAALPLIDKRQQLVEQLNSLTDAPRLGEDFSERRQKLLEARLVAQREHELLQAAKARTRQQLETLAVPEPLLRQADSVGRLQASLGAYRKAQNDRPNLVVRLQAREVEIRETLRDIGREQNVEKVISRGITRPLQSRLQRLARTREAWQTERSSLERRQKKLRRDLEESRKELAALGELLDVTPLEEVLQQARTLTDLESQLDESQAKIDTALGDWHVRRAQLQLGSLSREQIEELSLPSMKTIERFDEEWSELQRDLGLNRQRFLEHAEHIERLRQRMDQLRSEQQVPTEDELNDARQQRDADWQILRSSLLGQSQPAADEAARSVPAYEVRIRQADEMADRMRRQSEQVAEHAQCGATLQELQKKQRRLDEQREQLSTQAAEKWSEWESLWKPLGAAALPPREMREWTLSVTQLREECRHLRQQEQQMLEQQSRLATIQARVDEALRDVQPEVPKTGSLTEAVLAGQRILDQARDAIRRRLLREQMEQKTFRELEDVAAQQNDLARQIETWQAEWAECMERLELDSRTDPEEAQCVLEGIREVLDKHRDAEEKRKRISDIDQDADQFREEFRNLLRLVAQDLEELPIEAAAATLGDRLAAAQAANTERRSFTARLEDIRREEAELEKLLRETNVKLDLLCQDAGCSSIEELPEAERRAIQRRESEREVDNVHDQLRHLADGIPLEMFLEQAAACDREQLVTKIAQLTQEMDQLAEQRDSLNTTIGVEKTRLDGMDGGDQAAVAEEDLAGVRARIRTEVEQYARLKLAAYVLRETIEKYREKHQDPVLRRAGELFRDLTLGAFIDLRAGLGDNGQPVMQGVRPNGDFLGVEGMSDGASDQLYLALRVASLEHYFQGRKSIPFIVDDILVMFDDDRAAAALRVLSELATRCQVIFFTHHRHLLELAQANLCPDQFTVRHLQVAVESQAIDQGYLT